MSRRPVAAHLIRRYLSPTETFVRNQIATHERYEPRLFCLHQDKKSHFSDVAPVFSALQGGNSFDAVTGRTRYRWTRTISSHTAGRMAAAIQQSGASLLHVHYLTDARVLAPVMKRLELPVIVSAYGYDVSSFPRRLFGLGKSYLRAVFDKIDLLTVMTEDMKADTLALGFPPDKIRVHYHGIDTRRFDYPDRVYKESPVPVILCVGTLEEKKAQHLLLDALRIVEQRGVDFRAVIVGDGPYLPVIRKRIIAYKWTDRVILTGYIPHHSDTLIEHYRHADLFALPSITLKDYDKEGIPGSIVEAMASGLPVAATTHAGIPSVINDGVEGLLCPEKDLDALAKSLIKLLQDTSLRENLGRAAAERAIKEYDVHDKTRALEMMYDELIEDV